MAFASVGSVGAAVGAVSSTTLVITAVTAAVNSQLILFISCDNTTIVDGDNSEITSVVDSVGNTWVKLGEYTNSNGAANAGATTSVWGCRNGIALSSSTVTITFAAAKVDSAARIWRFTSAQPMIVEGVVGNGLDAAVGFGSVNFTSSNFVSRARLWVRALSKKANSTTAITVSASYTTIGVQRSQAAASAIMNQGEFRILTGTTSTSNPTHAVSGNSAGVYLALREFAVPLNLTLPVISGSGLSGTTLTTTTGTWSDSPTSYTYQWKTNGTNIGGATSSTYLVDAGLAGTTITCSVIALNSLGNSNAGVSNGIVAKVASYITNVVGPAWTTQAGSGFNSFITIASSADGVKLAAAQDTGYVYTSIDAGVNWTQQTGSGSRSWQKIVSSADGTRLIAIEGGGGGSIWISTDSGVTWTQRGFAKNWFALACSADGMKIVAAANNEYIYTSTDGGVNWTQRVAAGARGWYTATSSDDGVNLAICIFNGYIWTSTDSGVTWTQRFGSGSSTWYRMASSADGMTIFASEFNGYIYRTTDGGANWLQNSGLGTKNWYSLACSSDGTKVAAGVNSGSVWLSADSGTSFTVQTPTTSGAYFGIASSSDGKRVAAADYNGSVRTYYAPPPSVDIGFGGSANLKAVNLISGSTALTLSNTANLTKLNFVTLFDHATAAPAAVDNDTGSLYTLGTLFKTKLAGTINGVYIYRNVLDLTTSRTVGIFLKGFGGAAVATGTSTGEPASAGWYYIPLSTPFTPTIGVEYFVGSEFLGGHYVATPAYFSGAGTFSEPNTSLSLGDINGWYNSGATFAEPHDRYNSTNYWVDLAFFPEKALPKVKVWNGSTQVVAVPKVWNGSSWVAKPLKTWDGTSWG